MFSANKYTPPPTTLPSQPPRLNYFVSRSNGNLVPLIPADELPYSVRLDGVPRVITMQQTCGMQHVGSHPFTGQTFKVQGDNFRLNTIDGNSYRATFSGSRQRSSSPDARPTTSSPTTSDFAGHAQQSTSATTPTWRRMNTSNPATNPSVRSTNSEVPWAARAAPQTQSRVSPTPRPTSSSSPGPMKNKVYCTHWIRHGECDYLQQGCRYKHEMPRDKAALASIGLRSWPRWWLERTAVRPGTSGSDVSTAGAPSMFRSTGTSNGWLTGLGGKSCGSESNEEESASDSEEGEAVEKQEKEAKDGEHAATDAVLAQEAVSQHSDRAMRRTSSSVQAAATPSPNQLREQPIRDNAHEAVVSATATDVVDNVHSRAFSPERGNLIDLNSDSPQLEEETPVILPTRDAGMNRTVALTAGLVQSPPPSVPVSRNYHKQQLQAPGPRKVFVPAGESREFHVADARRQAQTQIEADVLKLASTLAKQQAERANKKRLTGDLHSQDMVLGSDGAPKLDSFLSATTSALQCLDAGGTKVDSTTTQLTKTNRCATGELGLCASMYAADGASDVLFRSNRPSSEQGRTKPRGAFTTPHKKPREREPGRRIESIERAAASQNVRRPRRRTIRPPKPTTLKEAHAGVKQSPSATATNSKQPAKGICRPRRPAQSKMSS